MCSKSIVFDPKNLALPIIKIAYKNCDKISIWPGKWDKSETNVLAIRCSQYAEMLPKNVVAPYSFRIENRVFLFNFHYANVNEYIDQVCQLHRASDLHAIDQNDMVSGRANLWRNRIFTIHSFIELDCDDRVFETQTSQIQSTLVGWHLWNSSNWSHRRWNKSAGFESWPFTPVDETIVFSAVQQRATGELKTN